MGWVTLVDHFLFHALVVRLVELLASSQVPEQILASVFEIRLIEDIALLHVSH